MVRKVSMVLVLGCFVVSCWSVQAASFREEAAELIQSHNLVKAAEAEVQAGSQRIREAVGSWYPKFALAGRVTKEGEQMQGEERSWFHTREFEAQVTQLIADGGKAGAEIRAAKLRLDSARAAFNATQQDLLLEAVRVYVNLATTERVLGYAHTSQESIRKQEAAEESRVRIGQGFSTDVVQAKAQLAGAEARRSRAEGDVEIAKNAYRALFSREVGEIEGLDVPGAPRALPGSLEEAVKTALSVNPRYATSDLSWKIAREQVRVVRGKEFGPILQARLSGAYGTNLGGRMEFEEERSAMLEMIVPFDAGLTGMNSIKAAMRDERAARMRHGEVGLRVEERVRNEWQNYATARQNAEYLTTQAGLAKQFLDLAQKDRQMGRRSLLDVLTAENLLVTAESNAAQAEAEVVKASYGLLHAMGVLSLESF